MKIYEGSIFLFPVFHQIQPELSVKVHILSTNINYINIKVIQLTQKYAYHLQCKQRIFS